MSIYRDFFRTNYSLKLNAMFEKAIELNKNTYSKWRNKNIENIKEMIIFSHIIHNKNIYIYGCGFYGKKIYEMLQESGIKVQGFIISDGQKVSKENELKGIELLSKYAENTSDGDIIILDVGAKYKDTIEKNMVDIGLESFVNIPQYILEHI